MKLLWRLAGLVALILLMATTFLFVRADRLQDKGILAYVTSSQAAPFLRDKPSRSGAVLMVLELGSPVRISDSATTMNQDWYYVDAGDKSGWLLASLVSLEPPGPVAPE
ncbi:MAG: SH3 domain-containing protein [Chloroflexota bacterium]|jgi:hypothetical protein